MKFAAEMSSLYTMAFQFASSSIRLWTRETSWDGLGPIVDAVTGFRQISANVDLTPYVGAESLEIWIEGITNSAAFATESIQVIAERTSPISIWRVTKRFTPSSKQDLESTETVMVRSNFRTTTTVN